MSVFDRVDFREGAKKKKQKKQKKEEKMRRKIFLEDVWLGGRDGKEMVGPGCFLP